MSLRPRFPVEADELGGHRLLPLLPKGDADDLVPRRIQVVHEHNRDRTVLEGDRGHRQERRLERPPEVGLLELQFLRAVGPHLQLAVDHEGRGEAESALLPGDGPPDGPPVAVEDDECRCC